MLCSKAPRPYFFCTSWLSSFSSFAFMPFFVFRLFHPGVLRELQTPLQHLLLPLRPLLRQQRVGLLLRPPQPQALELVGDQKSVSVCVCLLECVNVFGRVSLSPSSLWRTGDLSRAHPVSYRVTAGDRHQLHCGPEWRKCVKKMIGSLLMFLMIHLTFLLLWYNMWETIKIK